MKPGNLHSVILELVSESGATAPRVLGHQAHALFLHLVKRHDPALAERLHNEPGYRPFTISPLGELPVDVERQTVHACYLRVTLLDDGTLWQNLCGYFLEAVPAHVNLGASVLHLRRILSFAASDPSGWVNSTDWQTLFTLPARERVTMRFASPTAFSWGNRRFVLFPEPFLVWEGLLHVWNRYAPRCYKVERLEWRDYLLRNVRVTHCSLHTRTLHYPKYTQKGFVGTCSYIIQGSNAFASLLTTLAAFAFYAGVGYKTTMGMGQVRVVFDDQPNDVVLLDGAQLGAEDNTRVTIARGGEVSHADGKRVFVVFSCP